MKSCSKSFLIILLTASRVLHVCERVYMKRVGGGGGGGGGGSHGIARLPVFSD